MPSVSMVKVRNIFKNVKYGGTHVTYFYLRSKDKRIASKKLTLGTQQDPN